MAASGVEIRSISALWYAWGQIDAGVVPGLTLDDGFRFQREQKAAAAAYESGETSYLPSILSAWAAFVAARQAELAAAKAAATASI